jgi:hypothetical protein
MTELESMTDFGSQGLSYSLRCYIGAEFRVHYNDLCHISYAGVKLYTPYLYLEYMKSISHNNII